MRGWEKERMHEIWQDRMICSPKCFEIAAEERLAQRQGKRFILISSNTLVVDNWWYLMEPILRVSALKTRGLKDCFIVLVQSTCLGKNHLPQSTSGFLERRRPKGIGQMSTAQSWGEVYLIELIAEVGKNESSTTTDTVMPMRQTPLICMVVLRAGVHKVLPGYRLLLL